MGMAGRRRHSLGSLLRLRFVKVVFWQLPLLPRAAQLCPPSRAAKVLQWGAKVRLRLRLHPFFINKLKLNVSMESVQSGRTISLR